MQTEQTELFAIVELFGHTRVAGKVSEYQIGGASFIRIDVPETELQPAFSRIVHPNAVYAINPTTEEVVIQAAKMYDQKPLDAWDIRRMQEKLLALKEANRQKPEFDLDDDDDDDDDLDDGYGDDRAF